MKFWCEGFTTNLMRTLLNLARSLRTSLCTNESFARRLLPHPPPAHARLDLHGRKRCDTVRRQVRVVRSALEIDLGPRFEVLQNVVWWCCSGAKVCKYCRAWKMLSNAYFLAKFRFDTAENEPAKNLQNFSQKNIFLDPVRRSGPHRMRFYSSVILRGSKYEDVNSTDKKRWYVLSLYLIVVNTRRHDRLVFCVWLFRKLSLGSKLQSNFYITLSFF